MVDIIQNIDIQVLEFIQTYVHHMGIDKLFSFITFLGNKGFVWIGISLFLLINKKNRKVGVMVISGLILAALLGEGLIKNLVQRFRPFINDPSLKLIISAPLGYSFPSGHTMSSFAAAGVLAQKFKKYQSIFWGLAFCISFSRLYLLVHYPSDVVVGAILGMLCSLIVVRIFTVTGTNVENKYSNSLHK